MRCATLATVSLGAQRGQPPASPPAGPAATGASTPQALQFKQNVGLEVDAMQENIQKWNDSVFSFGELGFQEFETTKFLTGILRAERLHRAGRAWPAFRRPGPRGGDRASR